MLRRMTRAAGDQMPWNDVTRMKQIDRFVMLARSGRFTMSDLCEQFGMSHKTDYKA